MSVNVIKNGQLIRVAGGSGESTQTYFLERVNFPPKGDPAALYIAIDENQIYRYDSTLLTYLPLSNSVPVSEIEWKVL